MYHSLISIAVLPITEYRLYTVIKMNHKLCVNSMSSVIIDKSCSVVVYKSNIHLVYLQKQVVLTTGRRDVLDLFTKPEGVVK